MIVSTPSGNDCPRPGVVPFDANSSHFVLSTPAGGGSAYHTSSSLTSVAQDSHQGPLTPLRYGRGCSSGGGTRFGPLSCTFGVAVDVTAAFAVKPPLSLRAKRAPRAERALHRLLPAAGGNVFVGIRDPRAKYTSKMKQSTIQGGNRGSADVTKTEFDDLMMNCCSQKI